MLAQANTTFKDFAKPEDIAEEYPDLFTRSGIRYLLRDRKANGLSDCGAVVFIANRLYVHREKFFAWFASQTA